MHLWQVPWPPQVESMAMPFHDAESKTVTPGGTRTERVDDGPSLASTVNARSTRPAPSCSTSAPPDGVMSPSRARLVISGRSAVTGFAPLARSAR